MRRNEFKKNSYKQRNKRQYFCEIDIGINYNGFVRVVQIAVTVEE
jgi:hypothetical protein